MIEDPNLNNNNNTNGKVPVVAAIDTHGADAQITTSSWPAFIKRQ